MTERQQYDLIKRIGEVEIRRYRECVMADVVVNSEYEQAGSLGFRPLVTYISQNNIAMTAPVLQQENTERSWTVSFVMPANTSLSQLPTPKNSTVTLRKSEEHLAAALAFRGLTSHKKVVEKELELRSALVKADIEPIGVVSVARFDPPWKPGFARHNEVILRIKRSSQQD